MANVVKLFFDGGFRPDPIGMELAVVVRGSVHALRRLGAGSSMDAEWLALIEARRIAHDLGIVDAVLLGDAVAVTSQANGTAKCPVRYVHHLHRFRALPTLPGRLRIRYVRRSQNLAGIALAALHER